MFAIKDMKTFCLAFGALESGHQKKFKNFPYCNARHFVSTIITVDRIGIIQYVCQLCFVLAG